MRHLLHILKTFCFLCCLMCILDSCGNYSPSDEPDSRDSGTIYISVDESFKPVIDSQIRVYEASHPQTNIIALYKPEAECIRDLLVDSIRMVIITRETSKGEDDAIADSLKLGPEKMVIARDAVAVIVNPSAPDSLFTVDEIKQILKGKWAPVLTTDKKASKLNVKNQEPKELVPIFDGIHATSTVRFIIDSVLKGDSLSPGTMAAQSSEGVIDYVAKHQNAVGFIGVSWIGNTDDSTQISFLKKVKIAQLESTDIPGNYVLPVQANIYLRRYPLIRDLVYILKEKHRTGLGHAFANFISGERGQLIFRRAYLLPAQKDFNVRAARLND
jgi:phosphate transport system substrate-binding protein